MDDDGYVKIVDRKKELIITSGGKNISPANLEAALKMIPVDRPGLRHRRQRKFVSALLVLDPEVAPRRGPRSTASTCTTLEPISPTIPAMIAEVQRGVDEANKQFANVEQIKRFTLLGEEWLPDSDLLTPTSKLKRRGIHARYAAEIESMYV